ncbi:MAG: GGDEF domain-containing protein [Acetatifactor sp.]
MNCNQTTENEISLLNQYLLSIWAFAGIVTGAAQIIEGGRDVSYYLGFLVCAAVPFGVCLLLQFRPAGKAWVPAVGTFGFLLLYGYVCLTASNELVCAVIFPVLFLLSMYRNKKLFGVAAVLTLLINGGMVALRRIQSGEDGSMIFRLAVVFIGLIGCYLCMRVSSKLSVVYQEQNAEHFKIETERIIKEERYKYAYQDTLTGLGNRNAYQERLESLQNKENSVTCVVMIDVNGLKTANDLLGQSAGDELLLGMTASIREVFEEENSIFRLGGDEFLVFSTLPEEEVKAKIAALEEKVSSWRGTHIRDLSAAIGYAFASEQEGLPLYEVIKLADERMYANKRAHYSSSKHDRRHR